MEGVLSTKLTQSGQTTIPVEIRRQCGIEDGGRVYWINDGDRVYVSAAPVPQRLVVDSAEGFWSRIAEAEESVTAGRVVSARDAIASIRDQYDL